MSNSWNPGRPTYYRNRQYGQESENERRKRSFVIIGLPELPGGSENEMREQDHLAAMDIVRFLGINDDIRRTHVKRARNGPVLIITLESIESRDLIIKRSHFLRSIQETRHLKLDKAYTVQDIVQQFGGLQLNNYPSNRNSGYDRNEGGSVRRNTNNPRGNPHGGGNYW
uniref:Uncharacterized protein n=1 Tax=Panagrolaimus superbus TaxID=310955 RepID=A0A914Y1N4_9BILA